MDRFQHYMSFKRRIEINEIVTLTFSYDRPMKEIITEKGLFFRNRVILYVNSSSVKSNMLRVKIIPSKKFFIKELRRGYNYENIHANDEYFYIKEFNKHREYVIQQFLSWKILPPYFERFTWSLLTTVGTTILGIIITIHYNEIKAFIDKIL